MNLDASTVTAAGERDRKFHLHPFTELRQLERGGPLVIARNRRYHGVTAAAASLSGLPSSARHRLTPCSNAPRAH